MSGSVASAAATGASWFQRFLLPGFTLKAVVTRGAIAGDLLVGCMFIADRVGLVALIVSGYRARTCIFLATYVVPLLTIGLFRLVCSRSADEEQGFQNAVQESLK